MKNNPQIVKNTLHERRKSRIRAKIFGTAKKPRLSVFRGLRHLYVQLIDDATGKTLIWAKDLEIKDGKLKKVEVSFKVGELIAKKAIVAGIEEVVFDRGGNKYHGRVKAVADGARKGGLKF